ncbi:hypothetical protein Ddye_028064 [Dipteronia dyeriana]|uniref:Uncharacterized protein n=1 Tax=Dipteronia dyeriana TaxID=168575 RepID=A0AAD9TQA0_9ROSI|nr:hypothetical protein Ddye_028064 [Dipteronia dyeriana]
MIPAKFLSKIGFHELEIEGVKVKVCHVTDNTSVIDQRIDQLKASLNKQRPVVGIDVKVTVSQKPQFRTSNNVTFFSPTPQSQTSNDLLIIYGGNCCLVIKLANLDNFPSSILNLLADKNICFVGFGINSKVGSSDLELPNRPTQHLSLSNVAEVGQLAARVLKKPNLSKCGLEELDKEIRQTVTDSKANVSTSLPRTRVRAVAGAGAGAGAAAAAACPNWKAMVFSDEEINSLDVQRRLHS